MIPLDWFLMAMIILVILVNIRSFLVLAELKQKRAQMIEDINAIHGSMEEFVTSVEKENDELYQRFVDHIQMKDSKFDERIRLLEEKLNNEIAGSSPLKLQQEQQDDEAPDYVAASEVHEQENDKMLKLYKQGFSEKQIAKVLQMDLGEVELVLNMFKKKQSYQK